MAPRLGERTDGRRQVHDIIFADASIPREEHAKHVRAIGNQLSRSIRTSEVGNSDNLVIGFHERAGWSHLHVVHGCKTYEQTGACRCYGLRKRYERLRHVQHRRRYSSSCSTETWQRIIVYLHKDGRRILQVSCADETYRGNEAGENQLLGGEKCGNSLHERCDLSCGVSIQRDCDSEFNSKKSKRSRTQASESGKRRKVDEKTEIGELIQSVIEQWIPLSIQNFVDDPRFVEHFPMLKFKEKWRDQLVGPAFHHARLKWNRMTASELLQTLWERPWVLQGHGHQRYYDPWFSYQVMITLLKSQFNSDEHKVKQFLTDITNVVDKKVEKKNTFVVESPPSAGKTFFFDSLCSAMISVGHIANSVKGSVNRFAYEAAVGRRIALWNECTFCGMEQAQQAKMIMEGTPCPVEVKFKSNIILEKTPIIVTCNEKPWKMYMHENQAFMDRCYYYKWQRQPWLAKFNRHLNPLLWYYVFVDKLHGEQWDTFPTKDELTAMESQQSFYLWLIQHHEDKMRSLDY
nr:MAG: nonstructural protein NS1 [Bee densovirus 1]